MENLLITTIGKNENFIFNELIQLAGKYECHVNYAHVYTIGMEDTIILQITGNWSKIAKVEAGLPVLAKRLEIDIVSKRTQQEKVDDYFVPYEIKIIAMNQPGLAYEIIAFISAVGVRIHKIEVNTAQYQRTPLLLMTINLDVPADSNVADIREQFLIFCDEFNLDGTLEPKYG